MEVDLDRARALRVLGRGAMGTVFLVEADPARPGCGRYALKVFDKRSAGPTKPDADRRARWEVTRGRARLQDGIRPHTVQGQEPQGDVPERAAQ